MLKEVQPSTVLYSPSGKRDERARVLGQLIPEIVDGMKWSDGMKDSGLWNDARADPQPYVQQAAYGGVDGVGASSVPWCIGVPWSACGAVFP